MLRKRIPLVLAALAFFSADTAVASSCPKGKKASSYTVKAGESILRIALRFDLTIPEIEKANPGLDRDKVRAGQEIALCLDPSRDDAGSGSRAIGSNSDGPCDANEREVKHRVKSGETLKSLATTFRTSTSSILANNPTLSKTSAIKTGTAVTMCLPPNRRANAAKACGYQTPIHRHEVVPGEVIAQIAARYGVRTADILKLNPKLARHADLIRVGQEVLVCPDILPRQRVREEHVVAKGETFGQIAEDYGLTPKELLRFQQGKLDNPSSLQIGQKLIVWREGALVPGFGGFDADKGVLKGGQVLRPGISYTTKPERLSWGTPKTIRNIHDAITRYKRKYPKGPKVHIGDISLARGGKFSPHVSHQTGHDVDVGYVLIDDNDKEGTNFVTAGQNNLDVARSWALVKAFLDSGQVRYIFMDYQIQKILYDYALSHGVRESLLEELFQYPRGKPRHYGIIRHSKGHINHFHVRFRP
jgi:LysM repeat protein